MLTKNYKLLITTTNSLLFKNKPFYTLSLKNATSYFSKMNLKEKHSNYFKNATKEKNNPKSAAEKLEKKAEELNSSQNQASQKSKTWPSPIEALNDMKNQPIRAEHEIIQLNVGLNVDFRKGDQNVRGIFKMPRAPQKLQKSLLLFHLNQQKGLQLLEPI